MNKISIRAILSLVAATFFVSCSQEGNISRCDNSMDFNIYPDYKEVTIPCNIAPLNFSVKDAVDAEFALQIESGEQRIWVEADDKDFKIPQDDWQKIISTNDKEKKLKFTIAKKEAGEWVGGKPFEVSVVPDTIDAFLTYRLVPPGYTGWYKMGIYQHELATSKQSVIFENSHTEGNCVNCHTPSSWRSDRTMFHSRSSYAGTYILLDGKIERIDAKTDSTVGAFVYPSWHPNGRYIAFSSNKTTQTFHTSNPDRIEVFDSASEIIIYDTQTHKVGLSSLLKQDWPTFPNFSPDGKWLYYCTAKPVKNVGLNHKAVHYSLCRIPFNEKDMTFGDKVDTLYNANTEGRSVSFPRVSPDGRWLVFTLSNYGNFSIWHKDADLYLINLEKYDPTTGRCDYQPLTAINSDNVESYHTWSSTGRWLVFSSRRDDGLYTRPYFTYFSPDGTARKPFMLPQENPREYYLRSDVSYNIPEFMTSRFTMPMRNILQAMKGDSIRVSLR